jgi:alpha-beta hydrolase superfamily lysophospholipase
MGRARVLAAKLLIALALTGCNPSFPGWGTVAGSARGIATPTFTPLPAPIEVNAQTYSGGRFALHVPGDWNGGLILYAHGYEGEHAGIGQLSAPALGSWWLQHGYAWAASSYRSGGYRVEWFIDDMLALRDLVISQIGQPRWTILYGQSMGGHVVTSSLELHPGIYQAALAECGVLNGVGEGDYEVAYAAAAEYISGIPLLDLPDSATFEQHVDQWVKVMGSPGQYTDKGRQFDSVIKYLEGGDLADRLEGLQVGNRYTLNLGPHPDPSHAPADMPIRRAVDTRQIRFHIDTGLSLTDDELNAGVRRYAPAPDARSHDANPVYADLTGQLSAPLLTIHTTGDAWVPIRSEQEYRREVDAAGKGGLLVQRTVRHPGHCDFDGGERQQAFTDLVAWIEQGIQPDGEDVLTSDASTLGLRWTKQ